jgi:hypothetical protein
MHQPATHICGKCKRKDTITFSQGDLAAAKKSGGLFTRILDHGDHVITLKIDPNGCVRRETILSKELIVWIFSNILSDRFFTSPSNNHTRNNVPISM